MADPTQDAHTRKVKDLMPAGVGIEDYAEPERPSEIDLYRRRRSSYGLVQELTGTEAGKSILQQIWQDTGGQLPEVAVAGGGLVGGGIPIEDEEYERMLNRSDFATALEQGVITAQEAEEARKLQEESDARRAEAEAGSAFGRAQVTQAEVGEATPGILREAVADATFGIAFGELAQYLAQNITSVNNANAIDLGPGAGERREQRISGLQDNDLWKWSNKEITDEQFIAALTTKVDEASFLEEAKWALFAPTTYFIPLPVIDQIAGVALKTGLRSASEIARLSFKLTRAGVTGGRDLTVEMATSLATWAPGRAKVAQAAPDNVYGPYGEGQFRLRPGPISADDVYTVGGVGHSPYETYVSVKGKVARGITNIRKYTTDHFALSKNLENEIKRYWEKANPGRAFPAAYKFATELALVAGGIQHKATRRFTR